MDGGAQPSSPREPPGPGGVEQEGVPNEWDGGEGPPEVKRSQPLFIHGCSRQLAEEEPRASSLPSIPNPFPELCSPSNSPILSSTALGQGPPREGVSHVVKVFGEDGACRSLEVSAGTTARQLCETLVRRTRALQDHSWALVELHQHLALERCLEDHESVVEVQSSWPPGADSRLVFRKNFAKYELFKSNAQSLFPEVMVSSCLEANKSMAHSELIQNFLNSGSCPEVQGFLQLREAGRKVWKRFHFSLRRSGLYYSTKGTSKDPRHLQYLADLTESNIYYVTQGKKLYGTPTEFGFCIKPYKVRSGVKGLKLLCSEDEQSRSCWMAAFRLFKYGMQLYRNYQQAQARLSQPPWIGPTPLCLGQCSGGHGLLGVHRQGDREPQRGADSGLGGGSGLEEDNSPLQPARRLPQLPAQRRHPPHPALVPWPPLPGGHPAADRPPGLGGWGLPGAGEPTEPQGLRPVPVPPAANQALPDPAERGGGAALLHHGRRADALRRPDPAGGVPPDQPRHPALQAAPLLHLRGPLSLAPPGTADVAQLGPVPAPLAWFGTQPGLARQDRGQLGSAHPETRTAPPAAREVPALPAGSCGASAARNPPTQALSPPSCSVSPEYP
ncbi:growth factor receptor-bound protein 7 isoform X2 [Pogoniulus pusillus]|uniref:growth factor receptor-bound protein 7 isoform X2 n=1 Tax=Pogoniulus pusillus TaxID=488313 RepID=UPI0030B93990